MVGGVTQQGWRRAPAAGRGTELGNGCCGSPPGPAERPPRSVRALCRWSRGQGAAEVAGGGNCREICLPAVAVSGAESGVSGALGRGERPRGIFWRQGGAAAGSGRGFGGVGVCPRRRGAMAWRSRVAGETRLEAAGSCGCGAKDGPGRIKRKQGRRSRRVGEGRKVGEDYGRDGSVRGKRIEPLLYVIPSSGVGSRRRKMLVGWPVGLRRSDGPWRREGGLGEASPAAGRRGARKKTTCRWARVVSRGARCAGGAGRGVGRARVERGRWLSGLLVHARGLGRGEEKVAWRWA